MCMEWGPVWMEWDHLNALCMHLPPDQWYFQWTRTYAKSVQQHGQICGPGGQQGMVLPTTRVCSSTVPYPSLQRPGAFAIYMEPWHADIFDFLELKKNHGSEEKVTIALLNFLLLIPLLSSATLAFTSILFPPHCTPNPTSSLPCYLFPCPLLPTHLNPLLPTL